MIWVKLAALVPIWCAGLVLFPLEGLRILALVIFATIFMEWGLSKALREKPQFSNGRLLLNAVLFASFIPCQIPWWLVLVGCFLFFAIGEKIFGGTGQNIFHPVLVAIAILSAAFPVDIETKSRAVYSASDLFLSWSPAHIAGASPIAILIGAGIMFFLKAIGWEAPAAFIVTLFCVLQLSGDTVAINSFSAGLLFLAFFILTDSETSPVTSIGRLIYGIVSGLLMCAFVDETRFLLMVSGALLMANASVPLIDYLCRPKGARL